MIVAFSVIDVLGSYWYEYLNRTGKTNERAMAWYDTFCASDENPEYKDLIREVSSERLYKTRNSIVHFFGLGRLEVDGNGKPQEIAISIAANDLTDKQKNQMEAAFAARSHKVLLLRPVDFLNLVREGSILMLSKWKDIIFAAQKDPTKEKEHIEGILRIWTKINLEGAKGMSREQAGLPVRPS